MRSHYHSGVICRLNRFLFDPSEVTTQDTELTVTLPKDDYRTVHARTILGLHDGDTVRAGVVSCNDHDGLVTDEAVVQWIRDGRANGKAAWALQLRLCGLEQPVSYQRDSSVSLILALPSPLKLSRTLPMISQLGVDHLILTSAHKVPKDYFGSHLFRKPEELRLRLVEGLCQAGDVKLPQLHIVRNLSRFLDDELDELFPESDYARVIAHPQRYPNNPGLRMRNVEFPTRPPRMVIAVGPEGGWLEPDELERFQKHGFSQVNLGTRTLRSDVAVASLLSLAHDVCDSHR
jgi:RsmE family RNA methyltransferase